MMNIDHRLLRWARDSRLALGITILMGALGGLLTIAQARNLSWVVSRVFLENATLFDVGHLIIVLGWIVGLRGLLVWLGEVSAKRVAVKVKQDLRMTLCRHIVKLGPSYTRSARTGDLAVTALESIEALDAYFSQYLPQLVLAAVIPISILLFVFPLDPLSGLILLLSAPLIPIFMVLIGKAGEALNRRQFETLRRLSAHFLDSLQGLETLKLFGRSRSHAESITRASDEFARSTMGVLRVTFLSALVLEMVATLSTAVIAVEIGLRLLHAGIAFDKAFFLLVLAPEFYLPLRMLGTRFHAGMSGVSAVRKIFAILDLGVETGVNQIPVVREPPHFSRIAFSNVSYIYPHETEPALHDINLTIDAGQHIALVGRSGAGKSTLTQLLLRFLEPNQGQILIDDQPIGDIAPDAWSEVLAWVPQDPFIFNASIAENIRLGRPEAEMSLVESAAKAAHLHDFITSLPDGYETNVGEAGSRLSGGELQRLALARAFLKDARLIILDEPSSDLDPRLEAQLAGSTRELRRGRTVITIAHRLPTISTADQIVVLEQGHIVERGTHAELMVADGEYARMFRESGFSRQEAPSCVEATQDPYRPGERPSTDVASPENRSPVRILLSLLRFLRGSWGAVGLSVLVGAATISTSVGLLSTSSWLISAAALQPSIADLQVAIVGVRFFGIGRGLFRYLERLISHRVTLRLLSQLRTWLYAALEPLAPARLMRFRSGDLLTRLVADVDALEDFYIRVVSPIMVAFVISIGSVLFLGRYAPQLGWVLLAFHLTLGLVVPLLTEWISRKPGRQVVSVRTELNALLVENAQGLADLLAFGRATDRLSLIGSEGKSYGQIQQRVAWIGGFFSGLGVTLANGGMLTVLVMGITQVVSGSIPGVMLAALIMIALASFEAITPLTRAAQTLGQSISSAQHIFRIIDDKPEVKQEGDSQGQVSTLTEIHFSHLTFTYPGSLTPALRDFNAHLSAGVSLAIVGPSGAGKSTLLNLLLRFWEYQQGEIRFGDSDLRDLDPDDVRASISVVPQRPFFFNTSVKGNLSLARPEASQAEIEHAARQAKIHDFITRLPGGYDTSIGEHGLRLSGGERQRLAIARAILKDAPIIVLDEPTANLDPLTESGLLKTIQALMGGKTRTGIARSTILITHRLIGLEDIDEIIVLEGGEIVERGSQRELIGLEGLFHRMMASQSRILVP